jgi:hypothetical protein
MRGATLKVEGVTGDIVMTLRDDDENNIMSNPELNHEAIPLPGFQISRSRSLTTNQSGFHIGIFWRSCSSCPSILISRT